MLYETPEKIRLKLYWRLFLLPPPLPSINDIFNPYYEGGDTTCLFLIRYKKILQLSLSDTFLNYFFWSAIFPLVLSA